MSFNADQHISEVREYGFSIAKNVIDLDFCNEIIEDIKRLEQTDEPLPKNNDFSGYKTTRFFDLLNKGEVWERVGAYPDVVEVVRGVLGNDALLSTLGTAVIDPGETKQMLHCDDGLYGIKRPHKNLVCNTMWALTDFTFENGATQLVPGSHQFANDPNYEEPESLKDLDIVYAEMPAGSICWVVGTCYHGGGANVTDDRRWGLTINYCAGSQRQQENLMLAHSRTKLNTFSPELLMLIGLSTSNRGVGHIDGKSPAEILEPVVRSALVPAK